MGGVIRRTVCFVSSSVQRIEPTLTSSGPTGTLPQDLGAPTQNWLGRSQYAADGYFDGLLAELSIYNRALSAGEIRYLAGDR